MAANLAVKAKRELQARVSDVHKDVLQSEKDMFAVTTDMTRQYKVCIEGEDDTSGRIVPASSLL